MDRPLNVYQSNRLEILYQCLKNGLFIKDRPFERRLVIVPSPLMKSWLYWQLANDPEFHIAMGLEVCYLDQGIRAICQTPFKKVPTRTELAFAIEATIQKKLNHPDPLWAPIRNYLGVAIEEPLTRQQQRRLLKLCDQLAGLFNQYGEYGGSVVSGWNGREGWQQALWNELYHPDRIWDYPARILTTSANAKTNRPLSVHVFALSYLPAIHHRFLETLSLSQPVHYYLLSPCSVFWSDLKSDRQMYGMLKRQADTPQAVHLEELLRDRNPLLANFGRLGREMAQRLEESSAAIHPLYQVHSQVFEEPAYHDLLTGDELPFPARQPLDLLSAVQADLTLLRNPDKSEKVDLDRTDRSIEVHASVSRSREVEVLYHQLLQIIDRHHREEDPITPSDIIVMAPDILEYEPYIRAIFGSTASQLDFQLYDLKRSQNALVQAFLRLIQLAESRWEAPEILALFETPEFQRKQRLSGEEIRQFKRWIEESGIRWGENSAHRQAILKRDHGIEGISTPQSTWEFGFKRLLSGYVWRFDSKERLLGALDTLPIVPVPHMDMAQAELLGKWMALLTQLRRDLSVLDGTAKLPLNEWEQVLQRLFHTYLTTERSDEKEVAGLMQLFQELGQAGKRLDQETFAWASIRYQLLKGVEKQEITYRENHLQAVRFCSLLPMRAIPAKVVVLMGMEEGKFPKPRREDPLNLIHKDPKADFCPAQTDYDRYLFLEALLSARRYFLLSYHLHSADDGKELLPALVVTELLNYLDSAYTLNGQKPSDSRVQLHPYFGFDQTCFQPHSPIKNYASHDYHTAEAFYGLKSRPPRISEEAKIESVQPKKLTIKELTAFGKDPIEYYLKHSLGIRIEEAETKQVPGVEDFDLPALVKHQIKQDLLTHSAPQILTKLSKEGILPAGKLGEAIAQKIETDAKELHAQLHEWGVDSQQLFNVEFSAQIQEIRKLPDGNWQVPAVLTRYGLLTGTLTDLLPEGMLFLSKNALQRYWIKVILLNLLPQQIVKRSIFELTSDPKQQELVLEQPEGDLDTFLNFFATCSQKPTWIYPGWLNKLIKNDYPGFMKEVVHDQGGFGGFYSASATWFKGRVPLSEPQFLFWKEQARHVYKGVLT
jgi:exodeoxyribonuclease V gamma subunit